MDLISVIVPVYGVEKYLNRCVESIVNQTYPNIEIILVDDGSPDNCPIICNEWAVKDSRIRVIHKLNGGLSDARNSGMAIATGELIGFVDSDDWIAPEMYEKLLSAIHRDGSDIAACSVARVWESGSPDTMLTQCCNCVLGRDEAQAELLAENKLKQPVWYKLYRRKNIQGIFFEKGRYHEDVFWSYQAIAEAQKISIIDYIGYFYWQRTNSIMGEGYSIKRLDAIEAYCMRYEFIKEHFPELTQVALCSIWENSIYHGQMAMTYLKKKEQRVVFSYLKRIQRQHPICRHDYRNMKRSHRVWIGVARFSLELACFVKKQLKVGY